MTALYFAYGANMDRAAMAVRCPRSTPLGVAVLPGWRRAVMFEGWLTVAPARDARTPGVLWSLAAEDAPTLDAFEDVADGLYVKQTLGVEFAAMTQPALVYIGRNAGPGRPHADYLASVQAAAKSWGLRDGELAALAT